MGLEVVRQLVNQVAQDDRLLAPVRESIVALEPALMRLSMVDSRFFEDEKHPARLLMERTAQRSFTFNDELSPEFTAFFKPLTQAVNALNGLTEMSAARFDTALSALEKHWSAQDQAEATLKRDMLAPMQFAEARQTRADEIAHEFSTRIDLGEVPDFVLDFLFGPWCLAMAHARFCDTRHQLDPEGMGATVSALPWMGKQEMVAAGFDNIAPTAPIVPGDLRVDEPADESQPSRVRAQTPVDQVEVVDDIDNSEDPAFPPDIDTLQMAQTTLAGLDPGDWVDLYSSRRWLRAQLTWTSTKGTLFMFISQGGQPHSMTKRSCERLIGAGLLRPVNTRGVVAQALKALVAQAACQPDADPTV